MRDRVALITGGSRGIGAETPQAPADHGYDIAFTYCNKEARAREVIAVVTQRGVRGLALACNVTHSSDVESLFQPTAAEMGEKIAMSAMNTDISIGTTVLVGAAL